MEDDDEVAERVRRELEDRLHHDPARIHAWDALVPEKQRRWIMRLVQGERRRAAFEARIDDDPIAVRSWSVMPVTEQRELLASIDYLRFLPLRWELGIRVRNFKAWVAKQPG